MSEFIAHFSDPATGDVFYRAGGYIAAHGSAEARELADPEQNIEDGSDLSLISVKSIVYLDDPVYCVGDLSLQL